MKLGWVDWVLIVFGLFIAFQLLRKIVGGSWQTEGIIIALLVLNLGLTWKFGAKLEGHITWHRLKERIYKN